MASRWFQYIAIRIAIKDEIFIAKPFPFNGNFGIFEDSLPDGYGRYLLKKALMKEGIDRLRNLNIKYKIADQLIGPLFC